MEAEDNLSASPPNMNTRPSTPVQAEKQERASILKEVDHEDPARSLGEVIEHLGCNESAEAAASSDVEFDATLATKQGIHALEDDDKASPAGALSEKEAGGMLPDSVGGRTETPAFCLLDGVVIEESDCRRASISVTCLPATLGRQHVTDDETFISMGKLRVLSRQMLRIDYRTKDGILLHENGQFSFRKDSIGPDCISPIPEASDEAFFLVTSLGKNSILVNGKRLTQGQSSRIRSGDSIKVSCYLLYFLLPTQMSSQKLQLPSLSNKKKGVAKKRPAPLPHVSNNTGTMATKKKKIAVDPDGNEGEGVSGSGSNMGGWSSLQSELDAMSTEKLLRQFGQAVDEGVWDRRHQAMGHTLAYRAVLACAEDPYMQLENREKDGVLRSDILKWIDESDEFSDWSRKILTKMENKTFTANLTKALCKAGFERTTNAGRYIRWKLPQKGSGDGDQLASVKKEQRYEKDMAGVAETHEDEGGNDSDDYGDDESKHSGGNAASYHDKNHSESQSMGGLSDGHPFDTVDLSTFNKEAHHDATGGICD